MKIDLTKIHRSLAVQLGLLSLVFIALVMIMLNLSMVREDPQSANTIENEFNDAVLLLLRGSIDPNVSLEQLKSSDNLMKIAEKNPNFRYLTISEKGTLSFGTDSETPFFPERVYDKNSKQKASNGLTEGSNKFEGCLLSTQGVQSFFDSGQRGVVYYNLCPSAFYYVEVAGIENPVFSNLEKYANNLRVLPLNLYKYYLIIGLGVFLIACFIIFRMMSSLKEISRVTKRMNLSNLEGGIDEEKLPLEIVPMAQSLNAMVGRIEQSSERQNLFLAAAAHELKTPMTILRVRLEELEESELKNKVISDLRRISNLVDQLLKLTQLKSEQKIELTDVDLTTTVREVCRRVGNLVIGEGLKLQFDSEPAPVMIKGVPAMITTAVTNLIMNALSHSPPNDIVTVNLTRDGRVCVQDQGKGIPEGESSNIFEPFSKFPRNRMGHGLGLSIVKEIMNLHGGRATAQNTHGAGALFTLQFEVSETASTEV